MPPSPHFPASARGEYFSSTKGEPEEKDTKEDHFWSDGGSRPFQNLNSVITFTFIKGNVDTSGISTCMVNFPPKWLKAATQNCSKRIREACKSIETVVF